MENSQILNYVFFYSALFGGIVAIERLMKSDFIHIVSYITIPLISLLCIILLLGYIGKAPFIRIAAGLALFLIIFVIGIYVIKREIRNFRKARRPRSIMFKDVLVRCENIKK